MKYCYDVLNGLVYHVKHYSKEPNEKDNYDRVVRYFEDLISKEMYIEEREKKRIMISNLEDEIKYYLSEDDSKSVNNYIIKMNSLLSELGKEESVDKPLSYFKEKEKEIEEIANNKPKHKIINN